MKEYRKAADNVPCSTKQHSESRTSNPSIPNLIHVLYHLNWATWAPKFISKLIVKIDELHLYPNARSV